MIADLLACTSHRPWPLPNDRWVMVQVWSNLLFMHWPVSYATVRALVPSELPLDAFGGYAWIGITPFELTLLRLRGVHVPLVRNTPELNVRTYVAVDHKPGVYFFSLDIRSLAAVLGARLFYRLPYYPARMGMQLREGGDFEYSSERFYWRRGARFRGRYHPAPEKRVARPGSLEYFLAERYCLYTVRPDGVFRADIHHLPWPLQTAEVDIAENSMASAAGLELPGAEPLAHFSQSLTVLVWPPRRVSLHAKAAVYRTRRVAADLQ